MSDYDPYQSSTNTTASNGYAVADGKAYNVGSGAKDVEVQTSTNTIIITNADGSKTTGKASDYESKSDVNVYNSSTGKTTTVKSSNSGSTKTTQTTENNKTTEKSTNVAKTDASETKNQTSVATTENYYLNRYGITEEQYNSLRQDDRYSSMTDEQYESNLRDNKRYMESSADSFLVNKDDPYRTYYNDSLQYRTESYDTAGAVKSFVKGTIQYQLDSASDKNVYSYPSETTTGTETSTTSNGSILDGISSWWNGITETWSNIFNKDYGTGTTSNITETSVQDALSESIKVNTEIDKSVIQNTDNALKTVVEYAEDPDAGLISTNTAVSLIPGYSSLAYMYKSTNGQELTGWDYAGLGFDALSFMGIGAKLAGTTGRVVTKSAKVADKATDVSKTTKWIDDGADTLKNGDVSKGFKSVDDLAETSTKTTAKKTAGYAAVGAGAGLLGYSLYSSISDDSDYTYSNDTLTTDDGTIYNTAPVTTSIAYPGNSNVTTEVTLPSEDNGTVSYDGEYSLTSGSGGSSTSGVSGGGFKEVLETVTEKFKDNWQPILIVCGVIAAFIILSKNSKKVKA